MKNTSTINLLTTLLFFSHNASAFDEFCNLETDENYSLSKEAIDCFSGTWEEIVNDKKDVDDQTSFSLDKIGRQIIDKTSRTNNEASNQSSSVLFEVPNLDFSVDDSGQQHTQSSGFFTETESTTENTGSLSSQNSGADDYLQELFTFHSSPESHSFEDNTLSADIPPSFSETTYDNTTAANKNASNGSEAMPNLRFINLSKPITFCDLNRLTSQPSISRKRTFSEFDKSSEQASDSRPLKKQKIVKDGFMHLTNPENEIMAAYIQANSNVKGVELAEYAAQQGIKLTYKAANGLRRKILQSTLEKDGNIISNGYGHLNEYEKKRLEKFINENPKAKNDAIAKYAEENNIKITPRGVYEYKKKLKNPKSYEHLTEDDKTKLDTLIKDTPSIKPLELSKLAKEKFDIDLNRVAASSYLRLGKKTPSRGYSHLTDPQRKILTDYIEKKPKATGKLISQYAEKFGIDITCGAANGLKRVFLNIKK